MNFLSEKAVFEYMEIYLQEFGEEISIEEARQQAENFLALIALICWRKT